MNRKFWRGLGIALIALPDPTFITDVIGLSIIGATFLFPQENKPYSYKQTKALTKSYLEYVKSREGMARQPIHHVLRRHLEYSQSSDAVGSYNSRWNRDYKETTPEKITYHKLNRIALATVLVDERGLDNKSGGDEIRHHAPDRRIFIECSKVVGTFNADSQQYHWRTEYKSEKIVHHVLNRRLLLDSCTVVGSFDANSQRYEWRNKTKEEQVIYHKLNRDITSQYVENTHSLEHQIRGVGVKGELAGQRVNTPHA